MFYKRVLSLLADCQPRRGAAGVEAMVRNGMFFNTKRRSRGEAAGSVCRYLDGNFLRWCALSQSGVFVV